VDREETVSDQSDTECPDRTGPHCQLLAGVAKVDITSTEAGPINDPLYARALVLQGSATTIAIVTIDAVALAEIGPIRDDYLPSVRSRLQRELGIEPTHLIVNASHCHGIVCSDLEQRTVSVVSEAWRNMVPVHVGTGVGYEDRIMENRRLRLKSGKEADVRRAYSLPPDEEVAGVGPVDPQIGILRLNSEDGQTVAVVYNFACHPIQGVPSGGITADLAGFASRTIECTLGGRAVALFLQGCAGDVNPVLYKDMDRPNNAEVLGSFLGLSTLQALRKIQCRPNGHLRLIARTIELPAADPVDLARRIDSLRNQQLCLLLSLKGTNINLKTFVPLIVKYSLSPDFPSYYSYGYLHERMMGRDGLEKHDEQNRKDMARYIENIHTMEQLTRLQTNIELLEKHQAQIAAGDSKTVNVEVAGLRIGDFVLVTFPGELSVQIGMNIKRMSPHQYTFVAGYTNGYIYYAPTDDQLANLGGAQEDSDCVLAPGWQKLFEHKVAEILSQL